MQNNQYPKTDREDLYSVIQQELSSRADFIFVFGSFLHQAQKEDSDIDLAVYFRSPCPDFFELATLSDKLSAKLKQRADLVCLNRSDPIITAQVLYNGKLIYCRNRRKFIEFKTRKISEYIDFKQSRRMIENNLKKRVLTKNA